MIDKEMDVPKVIELIVKLQTMAEEAFFMHREKEELTESLQKMENKTDEMKKECENLDEQITDLTNDIKEKQNQIQSYIEEIKALKAKERLVRTQKEYIALDTEQSLKREKIEEREKAISDHNKQIETLQKSCDHKKQELNEQEIKLNAKRETADSRLEEIKDKMKNGETIRNEVLPEIDPNILARFEHIVKNKNGVGIVPVINGICEGCNLAITPQLVAKIRKKEEIVYCNSCARILYLPEKVSIF